MEDTSQNSPSSNAPASGAAPASAPAPAGGDTGRATSAGQALERAAARSTATPVSAPGAKPNGSAGGPGQPAQVAAPVAQPAQPAPAQSQAKGPIPFDAHQTALKNARAQARDEARQEIMQQFAWANGVDANLAQRALALAKRLDTDPRAFFAQLQQELNQSDDAFPEPDIKGPNGVTAYSAQAMQKFANALTARITKQMQGQIQPVLSEYQQRQQQEQTRQRVQGAIDEGKKVIKDALAHAMTIPSFKENSAAISKKMDEIPPQVRSQVGLVAAMYMAYANVLVDALDKAKANGTEEAITDLKRKANAGSGNAAPGGPVGAPTKTRPQNETELAAHMAKLATQMATQ